MEFNFIYCNHPTHDEGEPCNDECSHSAKCKNPSHDAGHWREDYISDGSPVEG